MNVNITLDLSKTRKNGHPIVLSIFVAKNDRAYPTLKYYSTAKDWDFKKEEPKKSHPLYNAVLSKVLDLKAKIHKLQNSNQRRNAKQVQTFLLGNFECIFTFWEQRIKEEEKKLINKNKEIETSGNAGFYETTLNVWKNYKETIRYEDITYDFLHRFKIEKSGTCTAGGINTYIKAIRAIYNDAVKRGIYIPEGVYPFNKIMDKKEPTRDKYLTIDEMKILIQNPIDHEYYRYFMLCFFLGGLDFIDIANLKKSDFKVGRLKKMRSKGNTREVINNYVFPEAQKIIDHFSDENSDFILPIYKFKYLYYRQNYARRVKKMFENIGIKSHIDSKSPRYSFIHIGSMELYQNRDIIKELVGHAQGDTLSIYEGKFPVKIKDEVHRKIIDAIIEVEPKELPADADYTDLA